MEHQRMLGSPLWASTSVAAGPDDAGRNHAASLFSSEVAMVQYVSCYRTMAQRMAIQRHVRLLAP